ncbi:hypothetical protein AQUCO_02400062v1 [Aquilegia coerulea]|uniref:Uncharacterized protein n=1 Tax=Aquilegia coerulea TaxID=218851 RepID=A0A2G5DB27_AQUCA|nr:hypothetical protein AQUCO_02400062v1 [Aquilegia coerulea]
MLKDSISELPDEILSFTLSLLPMREAARTSILSHRWTYLWKTSLALSSSLNLDVVTWRGSEYSNNMFWIDEYPQNREDSNLLSIERFKFVRWVNQIVQLDYSHVIESFKLRYYFKKEFAFHIDQWINMAISKKVCNFDIDFSHFHSRGTCCLHEELYTFPYRLFTQETGSLVKSLCLNSCIFGPVDLNYFSSLVDLRLEQVLINQDNFVSFLSNCPNLEKLCLVKCWRLLRLEISGRSLKLKYLAIVNCYSLKEIIIDARNLTRLEYWGPLVNISFLSVPQLSDVFVRLESKNLATALTYVLRNLSNHVAKLESLMLSMSYIKESLIPKQFANLKKLVLMITTLKGTLWDFISLLHASPYLHRLELHWLLTSFTKCEEGLTLTPFDSSHLYLKKIVLTGFTGSTHEIEFATYLVKSTTVLKKMTIGCRAKCYNPKDGFFRAAEVAEKKNMEEQASKQLTDILPPGVKLRFL